MFHIHIRIKRVLSAALSGCIALGMMIPADAGEMKEIKVESPVPEKVLVIGDSIATGYGLEGYDGGRDNVASYVNMLRSEFESELKNGSERFDNRAKDGQTSSQLLTDMDKGVYDELLQDADLVIVSIGGNDLMKTLLSYFSSAKGENSTIRDMLGDVSITNIAKLITGVSEVLDDAIASYGDNLSRIYEHIKSKSDAHIIVQTVYDPTDNTDSLKLVNKFVNDKINELNAQITSHSTGDNGEQLYTVADVYSAFSGQGKELTNIGEMDIHPNSQGHKVIFETVDAKVREHTYTIEVVQEVIDEPEKESEKENDTKSTILHLVGGVALVGLVVTVFIVAKKRSDPQ